MADKKISQLGAISTPLAGTEELPIVQSATTKKVTVAQLQAAPVAASTANAVVVLDASKMPQATSALTFDGNSLQLSSGVIASLTVNKTGSTGSLARTVLSSPTAIYGWYVPDNANFASFYDYIANAERINVDSFGNVKVSTGNLVIGTAGKGIDFSADPSAAGMTSELLDDYEEGTFTPTVTASSGAITSYTSSGTYTKVGRFVYVSMLITITNNGTGAGNLSASLPFTSAVPSTSFGREVNATGTGLQVVTFAGASTVDLLTLANAYPAANGYGFIIGFSYSV